MAIFTVSFLSIAYVFLFFTGAKVRTSHSIRITSLTFTSALCYCTAQLLSSRPVRARVRQTGFPGNCQKN